MAWEQTPLESYYRIVTCDALYITVKRGHQYTKEAVHVIYGVREEYKRELLSLFINPQGSASSWEDCLSTLKQRGVEHIDCIVADGLKGLENVIHRYDPNAYFQKCVVHKMRQVQSSVRPQHRAQISADLKQVFKHFELESTIEKAREKLECFIRQWKPLYPTIERYFREEVVDYTFSYIHFPAHLRRMNYTTHSIERLNKKNRKATHNQLSFENPERLLDYVFMMIKEFEEQN